MAKVFMGQKIKRNLWQMYFEFKQQKLRSIYAFTRQNERSKEPLSKNFSPFEQRTFHLICLGLRLCGHLMILQDMFLRL